MSTPTIGEAGRMLRSRVTTASDLLAAVLELAHRTEAQLHAYLTIDREGAAEAAARADADLADGIDRMFGNPGTVEQGFLDALGDFPQFRYYTALQETIAVAVADAGARGEVREYGTIANSPTALRRLVSKLERDGRDPLAPELALDYQVRRRESALHVPLDEMEVVVDVAR